MTRRQWAVAQVPHLAADADAGVVEQEVDAPVLARRSGSTTPATASASVTSRTAGEHRSRDRGAAGPPGLDGPGHRHHARPSMSATTTVAPRSTSSVARAFPIPEAAPVTQGHLARRSAPPASPRPARSPCCPSGPPRRPAHRRRAASAARRRAGACLRSTLPTRWWR